MTTILDYIRLSATAKTIKSSFTDMNKLPISYRNVSFKEQSAFLRYYIVSNQPHAFRDIPILYERLVEYLADKLSVSPLEIKLIGSAKIGFSLKPPPLYGKPFGVHSDLDFAVINENLFSFLEQEFIEWGLQFKNNEIIPKTTIERKYWEENYRNVPKNFAMGFVDTNKIPNRPQFKYACKINNSLSLIPINLSNLHAIKITKATMRVYKNWGYFKNRMEFNAKKVLSKLVDK